MLKKSSDGVVVQLVRIPACHAGGRGFESRPLRQRSSSSESKMRNNAMCGVVVQLVRIPACHAGGRGFESRPLRQQISEESDTKRQVFRKLAKI